MGMRTWWRRWRVVVSIIAACVIVYGTVVALYAWNDGTNRNAEGCASPAPTDSVQLELLPDAVDATGDRIVANLTFRSFGPLADPVSGLSTEDIVLLVTGTDGTTTHTIKKGDLPSPISVKFLADGDVERWPFDAHTVTTAIVVAHSVSDNAVVVPLTLCGLPHVPGWTFSSELLPGTQDFVIGSTPIEQVRIVAQRSAATVAFGIVILALMVVLPVLGLIVAISAFRGRRKVEATLTSWFAAMLFATIPMRNFLPGSPPIGSWVDYLVVLWVVVGLVAALLIYVLAWLKWTAAPDGAPPRRRTPAG